MREYSSPQLEFLKFDLDQNIASLSGFPDAADDDTATWDPTWGE